MGAEMKQTARGRYEARFDDDDWSTMEDGGRFTMFFFGRQEDGLMVTPYWMPPGLRAPMHYHRTHYMTIVLQGCIRVGTKWYWPGDMRLQEHGSVYGPEEAGPEGCYMLNIFADRRGAQPSLLGELAPPDTSGSSSEGNTNAHIVLERVWNPERFERGTAQDTTLFVQESEPAP
jgi:hypothetical protein